MDSRPRVHPGVALQFEAVLPDQTPELAPLSQVPALDKEAVQTPAVETEQSRIEREKKEGEAQWLGMMDKRDREMDAVAAADPEFQANRDIFPRLTFRSFITLRTVQLRADDVEAGVLQPPPRMRGRRRTSNPPIRLVLRPRRTHEVPDEQDPAVQAALLLSLPDHVPQSEADSHGTNVTALCVHATPAPSPAASDSEDGSGVTTLLGDALAPQATSMPEDDASTMSETCSGDTALIEQVDVYIASMAAGPAAAGLPAAPPSPLSDLHAPPGSPPGRD
jgi:hypothetical protein